MADIVTPQTRSRMMRAVRQKHTKPELEVRRLLRSLGLSYRISNSSLPGSPDIANRKRRWAVFVNGCYWHAHRSCRRTSGRLPESNQKWWLGKFSDNRRRDARKVRELRNKGFRVMIVWECQLTNSNAVAHRLGLMLGQQTR